MNKMLIMNEISRFARALEERAWEASRQRMTVEMLEDLLDSADTDDDGKNAAGRSIGIDSPSDGTREREEIIDPDDVDPYTGRLCQAQRQKISELLGAWEEPPRSLTLENQVASVSAVMQFRRGLAHMDTDQPFGAVFGPAETREACVVCSQNLYGRLLKLDVTVGDDLHFNAIASIAVDPWTGELDQEKANELIRIFRPERNGGMSLLDFVTSIDSVYKEVRMLSKRSLVLIESGLLIRFMMLTAPSLAIRLGATIAGNTKIDRGLESIFNVIFNVILLTMLLWFFNIDPLALFISLSTLIVAFAFVIGR